VELRDLLMEGLARGASDIHILAGRKPILRVNTELLAAEFPEVSPEQAVNMVKAMVGPRRFAQFLRHRDVDFSTELPGVARFRVNAHFQHESVAIAFRAIPSKVPALGKLGLPPVVSSFTDLPRGLVLVTGETGSGKSTTLAAMIDAMNHKYGYHVITLEDPIEYELISDKCVIEQREVGADVASFGSGLRHALRQDPDILLVGEMRDLETTSAAITAAETGHLVLSTLHTQSAAQTVERIVDIYPAEQQNQIRSMLANTLQAVISQTLFKRADGKGMVPAAEVLVCNSAVRSCVRENRAYEIPNVIQTGAGKGMLTLDQSIKTLFLNGLITREDALSRATGRESLMQALSA
jgi:twitching motility protein PilT